MKRFVFRLQKVYEYKQTIEKTQRAELADAILELRRLTEELDVIEGLLLRGYEGAMTVSALEEHSRWLRRLREEREALLPKIADAEQLAEQCRERLIQTTKELKAYDKLKSEQYAEWQAEEARAERSQLEDFIAIRR